MYHHKNITTEAKASFFCFQDLSGLPPCNDEHKFPDQKVGYRTDEHQGVNPFLHLLHHLKGYYSCMKWMNHRIVTFSATFAVTGDPAGAIISSLTSVLPDWIEGRELRREIHRKISHSVVLYSSVFLFLLFFKGHSCRVYHLNQVFHDVNCLLLSAGIYTLFGALLHILEDAVCGGVPLFFSGRVGLRLFRVGSAGEYVFSFFVSFILVVLGLKIYHPYLLESLCMHVPCSGSLSRLSP
jgi:inner membrane protein